MSKHKDKPTTKSTSKVRTESPKTASNHAETTNTHKQALATRATLQKKLSALKSKLSKQAQQQEKEREQVQVQKQAKVYINIFPAHTESLPG